MKWNQTSEQIGRCLLQINELYVITSIFTILHYCSHPFFCIYNSYLFFLFILVESLCSDLSINNLLQPPHQPSSSQQPAASSQATTHKLFFVCVLNFFSCKMGLFRDAGVVYKPLKQIDLGPDSNEFYYKVTIKGFDFLVPCSIFYYCCPWHAWTAWFLPYLTLSFCFVLFCFVCVYNIYIAPRLTGFLLKIFMWLLETRIIGTLMLYVLKRNNQFYKVFDKLMFD